MKVKKIAKRVLLVLSVLLLAVFVVFLAYASKYYHAGKDANAILNSGDVVEEEHCLALPAEDSGVGYIFYPGGKVEATAYLPMLHALQESGINCYLVNMPFHLAMFGVNKADTVMEDHPEITDWYIGGHSLGGAFSTVYANAHQDRIQGVVLLAAYNSSEYPDDNILILYGSNDLVLSVDKVQTDANVHVIEGGNHGQFGDYGFQKGDGEATITKEEQIEEATRYIMEFINEK